MALTTLQILTLSSFSGVDIKSILRVGDSVREISSITQFVSVLKECKIKKKNPDGAGKIDIYEDDLEVAERSAQRVIDDNERNGIGVISYYEDRFPQLLRETKDETGKKDSPPIILFYKGDIQLLKLPGIAIIGSRVTTGTGEKAGLYLAEEFAKRGFCIVSGLALGCDTFAHRGALNAKGKTVAFLGNGLDTVYPEENKDLANDIVKNGGLLLSEYPRGVKVNRYSLVERDRLQAGLALATIVIQTGERGGTMHAANATLNSQKSLYVVSYSDSETENHEQTLGNHLLFKKGAKKISGNDDLDKISESILGRERTEICKDVKQYTLF